MPLYVHAQLFEPGFHFLVYQAPAFGPGLICESCVFRKSPIQVARILA